MDDLPRYERLPFALYSATALPMVVAIANVGVRTGKLSSGIAAALVGAAVHFGSAVPHNCRRLVVEALSGWQRQESLLRQLSLERLSLELPGSSGTPSRISLSSSHDGVRQVSLNARSKSCEESVAMTNVEGTPRTHLETMLLPASGRAAAAAGQVALLLTLILCSRAFAQNGHRSDYTSSSQPPLLDYQELVALGEQETVDPALADKLNTLLTTPFINNEAYFAGTKPLRPDLKGMGPSLRLVEWNIERGIEFDQIKLLLTDKQGFIAKVHSEAANNTSTAKVDDQVLNAQMDALQSADVLVLNEVDWGMKRSDYRAVVKDLADALKMNWAYGVEFVEVDPKVLGVQSFANVKNEAERKELEELFSTNKARLLGLHGNAILSRYPLRDVKLVPFKYQAYDWYNGEKKYGKLEAGKRKGASLLFGEGIVREVRRGGRTNLIATIDIPDLPGQQVTIIAAHLENRTTPKGRVKQADELLDMIRPIHNPVIIAGDMNTMGQDGSISA